jgi:hypothetical protein
LRHTLRISGVPSGRADTIGFAEARWQAARSMLPRAKPKCRQSTPPPVRLILLFATPKFALMDVYHVPGGRYLPPGRALRTFRCPVCVLADLRFVSSAIAHAMPSDEGELCFEAPQVQLMDLEAHQRPASAGWKSEGAGRDLVADRRWVDAGWTSDVARRDLEAHR